MPRGATAVNPTAAALLGLLHDGPMNGGTLVAAAARNFGDVFPLTRSQVYRELPVLAEAGLVRPGATGPRQSRQYVLTADGRRTFVAWLTSDDGPDAVRSPLVLRLLHAGSLPAAERRALVHRGREAYRVRLTDATAVARGELDPYRRAVAEFSVAHAEAMLRLLEAIPTD